MSKEQVSLALALAVEQLDRARELLLVGAELEVAEAHMRSALYHTSRAQAEPLREAVEDGYSLYYAECQKRALAIAAAIRARGPVEGRDFEVVP